MADGRSITVTVRANIRQSLARELREAADALDPQTSPTAEDLRGAQAEIDRLQAIIRSDIPDVEADAIVEKVARALHGLGHPNDCYCGALGWEAWASDARAALAALAGDDRG